MQHIHIEAEAPFPFWVEQIRPVFRRVFNLIGVVHEHPTAESWIPSDSDTVYFGEQPRDVTQDAHVFRIQMRQNTSLIQQVNTDEAGIQHIDGMQASA